MNLEVIKQKFIELITSGKINLLSFEQELLKDFIFASNDKDFLEACILNLHTTNREVLTFPKIIKILNESIESVAKQNAKHAKIKNFKGSSFEENYLLTKYFEHKIKEQNNLKWLDST